MSGTAGRGVARAALWLGWLPALVVLLPLLAVGVRALAPAEAVWAQVVEHRLGGYAIHSAGLAAGVAVMALTFGIASAWVVSVYDFTGRRMLEWALLLPLAMPGYVAALTYVDWMPHLTPMYVWIRQNHGLEAFRAAQSAAPWVFSIMVLGSTLFPYVFLGCRTAFSRRAAGAVEAARVLGAGPTRVFWRVALPLARPAMAAGGGLVALEALSDVGVVTAFGLPTLTPGIFRVWGEGHPGVAMRLALLLLLVAIVGGLLERGLRGRRRFDDEAVGEIDRRRLGGLACLRAWILCGVPLVLGFILPASRLVRWAAASWERTEWDTFGRAAWHSVSVGFLAVGLVLLATLLVLGARRGWTTPSLSVAQRLAGLGYAAPAALVAVGVATVVAPLARWVPGLALSTSVFGLVLAASVRYLAAALNPVAAGWKRIPLSLHEAARTLGAGPVRALGTVDLPLLGPALVAAATLVFLDVFKELPMTLVLRPFDYETLATLIFRLADESRIPEIAIPSLCLVLGSLPVLIPLNRLLRHATR